MPTERPLSMPTAKPERGKVTVEELMNNYLQASVDTVEKYLKAMKPMIAGWEADFGKGDDDQK